jgi:hypothetical protein
MIGYDLETNTFVCYFHISRTHIFIDDVFIVKHMHEWTTHFCRSVERLVAHLREERYEEQW